MSISWDTITGLLRSVRRRLPRRPKRYWKYVSPQRRGVGLVVLALLLVGVYGWWYLTNDARIRRQAIRYLREVTGAHVRLDHASFRLFGPIELQGVRLDIPGKDGLEPFFSAKTVRLQHRPWAVFVTGTVEPTEIICIEPTVIIEHDQQSNTYSFQRLFHSEHGKEDEPAFSVLPRIRARGCKYHPVEVVDGSRLRGEVMVWDITMVPKGQTYEIQILEESQSDKMPTEVRAVLDVKTGRIGDFSVSGDIPNLARALPQRYQVWREVYGITGKVHLRGQDTALRPGQPMEVQLQGVSLKLPAEQGGLDFEDVYGVLAFTLPKQDKIPDAKGTVELRGITGKIVQAGGAKFRLSGVYDGYEPTDPFKISFEGQGVQLPRGDDVSDLGKKLGLLNRMFSPDGKMDVKAEVSRKSHDAPVEYSGQIKVEGISAAYMQIPYRLENLHGQIQFSNRKVLVKNLKGLRHGGEFAVSADVSLDAEGDSTAYDIGIRADNAKLDKELYGALPSVVQQAWDTLSLDGRISADVQISQKPGDASEHVRMEITADGKTSASYSGVPYPLKNLSGRVHVDGDRVWIDRDAPVRGDGKGKMRCTVFGKLDGLGADESQVDLSVRLTDVPLDDTLAGALGTLGEKTLKSLQASGVAERVVAEIRQAKGSDLTYTIRTDIRNAKIRPSWFPYQVEDIAGTLRIDPDKIVVEPLSGRHGRSPIRFLGTFYTGGESLGMDLKVRTVGTPLDQDVYSALPTELQRVYKSLSPEGIADVNLWVRRDVPDQKKSNDYRLEMLARGLKLKYEHFPYQFQNVNGLILARPGRVELKDLTAAQGKMSARMTGVILTSDKEDSANVTILARNIPIDQNLLKATPSQLQPVFSSVRPEGTCDMDLNELKIKIPVAGKPLWNARGSVWVNGAKVDIAFGEKELSGKLSGSLGMTPKGLKVDVVTRFSRVLAGKRELTNVRGVLRKKPDSEVIVIDDVVASIYGGKVGTREAYIYLTDPMKYSFRVIYEGIQLGQLVNAGLEDPAKGTDIKGRLSGEISLEANVDEVKSRRALGEVTISQGKMYNLPIFLGMMHVLYLSWPSDTAFTEGYLKYRVQGQEMFFDEIYLSGNALSLVGAGTMDMGSEQLDLRFLAGPSGRIPRIKGLGTAVLTAFLKELYEIRVSGTLAKPIRKDVPLRSLDAILNALLRPEESRK